MSQRQLAYVLLVQVSNAAGQDKSRSNARQTRSQPHKHRQTPLPGLDHPAVGSPDSRRPDSSIRGRMLVRCVPQLQDSDDRPTFQEEDIVSAKKQRKGFELAVQVLYSSDYCIQLCVLQEVCHAGLDPSPSSCQGA